MTANDSATATNASLASGQKLAVGDNAPDFAFPANAQVPSLAAAKGQAVIVYFYPKDDTPGCTKEACGFQDNLPHFDSSHTLVIGVSRDDEASHAKFSKKFSLTFPLAADIDGQICQAYGTWVEKSMYGKTYMGVERATFLIDPDGKIAAIWRNVKVDGHVQEVLAKARQLRQADAA
ncbi:MAG: peroxiredoxin [Alphaproteobacteria bacterium]|nr:peroxiredoxin [Alphaproteobacteria bacterium]